ncbi:MAG: Fe-S protein assembly co-chaperone HscB [Deltaproteobacteria bacterium]|nr:Fe-S protein assembly co-chaperone HscB [Deltaproteobacteria bacterium]
MGCWGCQAETGPGALCPACGRVQPLVPGKTYFDLFGLEPVHALDTRALDARYRELSLKLHPDRVTSGEPRARRHAVEQTAELNAAYKALKDPTARAFYLLKLQGVDLLTEQGGHHAGPPLEFLEEVMELREALDGARQRKDLPAAQAMGAKVDAARRAALEEAVRALESRDTQASAHALMRVRYFQRFLEEVAALEEEAL